MANQAYATKGATPLNLNEALSSGGLTLDPITQKRKAGILSSNGLTPKTSLNLGKILTPSTQQAAPTPGVLTQPKPIVESHTPSTPVKSITDNQGNKVEFHSEPKPATSTTTATQSAPQGPALDTQSNAQRVIQSGQATPLEQTYIDRAVEAEKMRNAGLLGQYAEAGNYMNQSPEGLYKGLITQPDLVGRSAANTGLYNAFGDIYGAAATRGLQAANTIANRGQQAATTVFSAGLPEQAPYTNYLYNPLSGKAIGNPSPFTGGQASGLLALGQQFPQLQSAHVQSQGIKNTIQQYLNDNPALNPSSVTDVNKVAQWLLGGKLGDAKYQTLANYLQEYVNTLAPILGVGGDVTNLKTEIANSFINGAASGQNLSQVLDNIDQLAEGKLQSMANVGSGNNQPANAPRSNTGGFAEVW